METIIADWWPQISALVVLIAVAAAFRADVTARLKVLEEKIATLFNLWNSK
jgi:hypothetical protein